MHHHHRHHHRSSMGRGAGESSVFVGEGAETFYDTQQYQYGVREKWGYCSYDPNTDSGHHIYPKIPDGGLFIKPWEYGGHPHDFLKASRQARSNDPYVHYEQGKALQRHEKLVAEVEAWRRRELLKEQMLIQLSKLQAVEKQRHHFQELRRHIQLEQLKWSRPMTAASGATSTPQASREGSLNDGEPHQPHRPGSVNLSTQDNSLRGSRRGSRSAGGNHTAPSSARSFKGCMPPIRILNPSSASAKAELRDLDHFDERLESLLVTTPAPSTSKKHK